MKQVYLLALAFISSLVVANPIDTIKTVSAFALESPLTIDAVLNEPEYRLAEPASDFYQLMPYNGRPALQRSEVRFFYDQSALYVGAMLYDTAPDSIFNFLSARDAIGSSDYFGVYIDPYNRGQLAYGFFITPAGVQTDIKAIKKEYDMEDGNWDAVWESKTRITEDGWVIEMRIPYSALRFPENTVEDWGLNMFRRIRRFDSNNSWNFVDRNVDGFIHQQGRLTGIRNIKPPVRLSFSPYMATYLEKKGAASPEFIYKGGLDLKYGLSESHTLDMMVIPDFGQVQSDDQELNLSPYELYFDEKRQFFNEGTELFQRADIFYSRRIGAAPLFADRAKESLRANEVIRQMPGETQLVNATKVTGRSPKGWGIGVLNAMSLPSNVDISDTLTHGSRRRTIQPFTNYNVMVVDKSLKNNSYISFINTNVSVWGDPFYANVSGTEFQIRDRQKKYALSGTGVLSNRYNTSGETGFRASLRLKKNNGKFQYGVEQSVIDDKFNPNDLGYLRRNNEVVTNANFDVNLINPFFIFREMYSGAWFEHTQIYEPNELFGNEYGMYISTRFKNYYHFQVNAGIHSKQHDYYEPRVKGRYFLQAGSNWYNLYLHSDNRKIVSMAVGIGGANYVNDLRHRNNYGVELNWRAGQKLNIGLEHDANYDYNDVGFVDKTDDETTVFFGKRNVVQIENTVEASYAFNNKLSMRFRSRHYWSAAKHNAYFELNQDGTLSSATETVEGDMNYNAFNIDMTLRWVFAPGSELSLAWKNEVLDDNSNVVWDYKQNLKNSFELPQTNSISFKLLYYIDYNLLRKRRN